LFSNWGTYPDNSPYKGDRIQKAITFGQHDSWSGNTYAGPWSFVAVGADRLFSWDEWRAAPYGQDAKSTITG
jgi:hypothetical protein